MATKTQKATHRKSLFEPKITEEIFPVKINVMNGAQSFLYHWHDAVEILYGLEKTTTVGITDEPYVLSEGDITIIGPRESHCLFPSDFDSRRLAMVFEPSYILDKAAFEAHKNCFLGIEKHSSQWPKSAQKTVKLCMTKIYEEFSKRSDGWREAIYAELMMLTLCVIREIPKTDNSSTEIQNNLLTQVLSYLSKEYPNPISLESCANALGFNASYLSQQFKKHTGSSFHGYLLSLRLNKVEWLLENSEMPIALISESAGFSSLKTFHRVFLERYGTSPGSYRKNAQVNRIPI